MDEDEGLAPHKEVYECSHSLGKNVNSQWTSYVKVMIFHYKILLFDENLSASPRFKIVMRVGDLH